LLLLREALPEYEINPHMRLANVVKGKLSYTRAMGQYEMDFVVQDPDTGAVVCAIELDDSTHDTEDGRRRDANKNRWMAQAGIKLIRIRMPDEANNIRELMDRPIELNMPEEIIYAFEKKPSSNSVTRTFLGAMLSIIFIGLVAWGFTAVVKGVTHGLFNKVVATQQQQMKKIMQQNEARQNEVRLQKQQEIEQSEARRRVEAQQPHYERMLVKGKSSRECAKGNVITNETILCTKDHYEMVLVSAGK